MDFINPPTDTLYKFVAISGAAIVIAANIWSYRAEAVIDQTEAELDRTYIQVEIRVDALISNATCFHDVRKLDERISNLILKSDKLSEERLRNKSKFTDAHFKLMEEMFAVLDELLDTLSYAPTVERFQANSKNKNVAECWQSCCNKDPESYRVFVETITPTILNNQYASLAKEAKALRIEIAKGDSEFTSLALATNRQIDFENQCWIADIFGVVFCGLGLFAWWWKSQRYQDLLLKAQVEKALADVAKPSVERSSGL